jgi:hypothetical protein
VFVDDGWWRTKVLSATSASITVPIATSLNIVSVALEVGTQHTILWLDGVLMMLLTAHAQRHVSKHHSAHCNSTLPRSTSCQ